MSRFTEVAPTPECLDLSGKPIVPGSIIVYGVLLGRSASIDIGRVVAVKAVISEYALTSAAVEWRITVQGISYGYDFSSRKGSLTRKWQLKKKGTLMFPERMCVISPDVLNDEQRQLLGI